MRPDLAPPEPDGVPAAVVPPLIGAWRGLSQTDGRNDDDDLILNRLQRRLRGLVDPECGVLFIGVHTGGSAETGT